jgi:hypothetical protein
MSDMQTSERSDIVHYLLCMSAPQSGVAESCGTIIGKLRCRMHVVYFVFASAKSFNWRMMRLHGTMLA